MLKKGDLSNAMVVVTKKCFLRSGEKENGNKKKGNE
jgi:hypothetical protein